MGDVIDIFRARRSERGERVPSRRDGYIDVRLNDGEVELIVNAPWLQDTPFVFWLPGDSSRSVQSLLSYVSGTKERAAKDEQDAREGKMVASLWGCSTHGDPLCVATCTVQMIGRTAFGVRLRVLGSADWHPYRTKRTGEEFTVHAATGEQVNRLAGRRYWQVEPEHVYRLKTGGIPSRK